MRTQEAWTYSLVLLLLIAAFATAKDDPGVTCYIKQAYIEKCDDGRPPRFVGEYVRSNGVASCFQGNPF